MVPADRGSDNRPLKAQQSRDWYAENKDDYNAARRHRYSVDRVYREKQRRRASKRRRAKVDREWILREGEKLFRIGAVAKKVGRSEATLRKWHSLRLLPPCRLRRPRGHRVYLEHQVELIMRLAAAIPRGRPGADGVPGHKRPEVSEVVVDIRRLW